MDFLIKLYAEYLLEYLKTQNQTDFILYLGTPFFIVSILGFLFGWYIRSWKTTREIAKIDAEVLKEELLNLEKLQIIRNKYIENVIIIKIPIQQLIDALLVGNADLVLKYREETIDFFLDKFVNSFDCYLEANELFIKGNRDKILYFIDDEILEYMETVKTFLSAVNNHSVLKNAKIEPIKFSKAVLNSAIRYVNCNWSIWNIGVIFRYFHLRYQIGKLQK